jgi:hypothetical protein
VGVGPVGEGDGEAIGGRSMAGVRVEGKRVWTLRGDCAAARGQRRTAAAAKRRRRRRGGGAIAAVGRAAVVGRVEMRRRRGEARRAGLTCGIDDLSCGSLPFLPAGGYVIAVGFGLGLATWWCALTCSGWV